MTIKRIARNAVLLALFCVIGMFSIPLGNSIKLSLQFLIVLIVFGITDSLLDKVIITSLYLLLGLFLPIYAGFASFVTPTFGYVIGFVLIAFPFHFIYKSKLPNRILRYVLASLVSLILLYFCGTIFMYYWLHQAMSLEKTLMVSVVPYIAFDISKIVLAFFVIELLHKAGIK